MKKEYIMPEMILRQVNICLMQDGMSLVDNPKPGDPGWDEMESRDNGDWFGGSEDVWED